MLLVKKGKIKKQSIKNKGENKMPKLMSMSEFLNSGSKAAISNYNRTGILPNYVARSKGSVSTRRMGSKPMQSSPFKKKKKMAPVKKKTRKYSGM